MSRYIVLPLLFALHAATAQVSRPSAEESAQASIEKILAAFDVKKYDEALAGLQELQKQRPEDPLVINLIGSVYTKKQNYQQADEYFRLALLKSPDFFPAQYNLGELLFLEKKYAEAREHFQAMRAKDARNELLQFKVVLCDLQLNEDDRAKKVMNAIKYPGDSPAWYYAQAAWENKKGNNKKAREYVAGAKFIFGPKTALFDETFETMGLKLK
jgi:predicted Zn-dependent protease